jgi:hypothetical protein
MSKKTKKKKAKMRRSKANHGKRPIAEASADRLPTEPSTGRFVACGLERHDHRRLRSTHPVRGRLHP